MSNRRTARGDGLDERRHGAATAHFALHHEELAAVAPGDPGEHGGDPGDRRAIRPIADALPDGARPPLGPGSGCKPR
ncbi:hypothetical protein WMF31_03000 [Sorangium sp. So ce1036]|uniref:hypothetical protein n=1 Tax=Sorangium TaxID=39643 RepID=UPI0013EB2515|nr:hypothetical protein [Sorangium cellulosum]